MSSGVLEANAWSDLRETWKEDPFKMKEMLWPRVRFYDKQEEIIDSVWNNKETVVVAGNMLGKDFVAGFIAVAFFLVHYSPPTVEDMTSKVRIVTTSVKEEHLRVLWAEIVKFISTSKIPLSSDKGGPIKLMSMELRNVLEKDLMNPVNYVKGMTSSEGGESLSGHHAENTLYMVDEASGVADVYHSRLIEWGKKGFVWGNPNDCNNFFRRGATAGDDYIEELGYYARKVIKITAEDSPNVRLALRQKAAGQKVTEEIVVSGCLEYAEYLHRRRTWDKIKQCVGLDAIWYEGADLLMFPPEWRAKSILRARILAQSGIRREGKALGVDTAEGGDSTSFTAVDDLGVLEQVSLKTPDTAIIPGQTLAIARKWNIPSNMIMFDQGGGGQEHADRLRAMGHKVRTVSFGESVTPEPTRWLQRWEDKQHDRREKFTFKNRRAQLYWILRQRLDPYLHPDDVFAIPGELAELHRQLAPIPLKYDDEGRVLLLPKRKKQAAKNSAEIVSLEQLLGCSPDEADSLVLALWAMEPGSTPMVIKSMF